jgi:uncharacterized protein
MKVKLLQREPSRIFAVVLSDGDEVPAGLLAFAEEHRITGASLTAIGAFEEATVAFFNPESKEYEKIPVREQAEVLTLAGNLARHGRDPKLHAHVVLGLRDGSTRGGHLVNARVRPTLEVTVIETPAHLRRRIDEATGLPLLDLEL